MSEPDGDKGSGRRNHIAINTAVITAVGAVLVTGLTQIKEINEALRSAPTLPEVGCNLRHFVGLGACQSSPTDAPHGHRDTPVPPPATAAQPASPDQHPAQSESNTARPVSPPQGHSATPTPPIEKPAPSRGSISQTTLSTKAAAQATASRAKPTTNSKCFSAAGTRTSFVVVRHLSFTEAVLPKIADILGCEEFAFRMGNTTFPGERTNDISFGKGTDYRKVQSAIRAAKRVGASLDYVLSVDWMPANTIWLAHVDTDDYKLSPRRWSDIDHATTEEYFIKSITSEFTTQRKPKD